VLTRALAPLALLLAWIAAFGSAALGRSVLAFDDHPGQLYRAWLVATSGVAPYRWHDGWWAGYAELQFYPPGHAYAIALLDLASFGTLGVDAAYQAVLWLAYAAPGLTAWLLLTRVIGNGWLALPGAFVVLSLSAGVASGVEGGVHVGMVGARLGWATLPLLLLALLPPVRHAWWRRAPFVIPLVATIVLMHPAHLPAAAVAVLLAAVQHRVPGVSIRRRLADALFVLAWAAGMSAFWSVPLVARAAETRALAWGSITSSLTGLGREPLLIAVLVLAGLALCHARTRASRFVVDYAWAVCAVVAVDAVALEPLGVRWLPAERVLDSAVLALTLAAAVSAAHLGDRLRVRMRVAPPALALGMAGIIVLLALPGRALTLWPARGEWPSLSEVRRGLRLDALWSELRDAPAGRVLFVRSGVPLVYGTEWWRPHTHVTALTPRESGRSIIHGTFTHPSPVAAFLYRGDAGPAPVRALTETRDGRSLFGAPLAALDAMTFARHADRLGVSVVVAIEDDRPALGFLDASSEFLQVPSTAPFLVWSRSTPVPLPHDVGHGTRVVELHGEPGTWTTARVAYSPLWLALDDTGRRLDVRRGEAGDLEVRLSDARADVRLVYRPGIAELAGGVTSIVACAAWIGASVRAATRTGVSAAARAPGARPASPGA
jgi:hypothetical protein